ncbi:ABC transporter ATP-binding protein [Acuticoccus sp. MNP-M23]|uniref:ABC transporter ATP-binding protein n=1 Tax=Acuticoccus sp. MNP-M23 TaxID=3072793 RepID=UPI0028169109|nr:ABC transporter ATP-binding protein [Acuticoccus sp. MNP-M23]WMS43574.1 ABC transporter ATP-binding protein [Acuticoccus sp. MNP-M23]
MPSDSVMQISDLVRTFGGGRRLFGGSAPAVHAVRGVSLAVRKGETLGVVGESGCGKSTLARMMVGLDAPTAGTIRIEGEGGAITPGARRAETARVTQYVFQDNSAALNPRKTIRAALEIPLRHLTALGAEKRKDRLAELMALVNLDPSFLERYPHELSGGQAQRVGIARALAADPQLLVLDEPVSGLDVSMQAQVLNLLAELKARLGLTFVFISHDLSVVEAVSDRVAILYFGKVAEVGPVRTVFARPQHHYTALLLRSVPAPGRPLDVAEDEDMQLPDPYDPPQGCAFAARCPAAEPVCQREQPPLAAHGDDGSHTSACHFPLGHPSR